MEFWPWLCEELRREDSEARRSGGQLPVRPICLSEVEAVGLMMLVLESLGLDRGGSVTGAARRLAATLERRLESYVQ